MARSPSEETTLHVASCAEASTEQKQPQHVAHLVALSGANVGKVYRLPDKRIWLGRDANADIQLLDPGISRRHAEITRRKDGQCVLKDAGSRNGTYANSHRLEAPHMLKDGDKIQLGLVTILKFSYADDFEASYAQRMYDAALRDDLTGVFNRRYFDRRLNAEFSFSHRHQSPLSLLLIDIDHFKQINDDHGHPSGDEVLRQITGRVATSLRAEDVFARYGGEEFAVLCRETDLKDAAVLSERIRHRISESPYEVGDTSVVATTSIGVVVVPDPGISSPAEMVSAADKVLYEAKERGRNCVIPRRPAP